MNFELPDGLTTTPIEYPAPIRFPSPGDIESFGYEGRAFLFARLEGVSTDAPAPEIRAKASWLACRDSCIKQSGEATLDWTRSLDAPTNAALLEARARVPASARERGWSATWSADQPPALRVEPGADRIVDLFPADPGSWLVDAVELAPDGAGLTLRWRSGSDAPPQGSQGVALLRAAEGAPSSVTLDFPWPTAPN